MRLDFSLDNTNNLSLARQTNNARVAYNDYPLGRQTNVREAYND